MDDWNEQTGAARAWFETLRTDICAAFEAIEREAGSDAQFTYTPWNREEAGNDDPGGGGGFSVARKQGAGCGGARTTQHQQQEQQVS